MKYVYTNTLGYRKIITFSEKNSDGFYECSIWSADTGDFCGSAIMSEEELKHFINYYNATQVDENAI